MSDVTCIDYNREKRPFSDTAHHHRVTTAEYVHEGSYDFSDFLPEGALCPAVPGGEAQENSLESLDRGGRGESLGPCRPCGIPVPRTQARGHL